jgi:hypothetical protein
MTVLIENLCKKFGSYQALDHVVRPEKEKKFLSSY